jgi:hypothetical protein
VDLRRATANFFTNWSESKAPLHVKLALTLRNRALAFRPGHGCCGHPGQPGC